MVNIKEQELPSSSSCATSTGVGVQFGFEDLFQLCVVPCTRKRKESGFGGQNSVSKIARAGSPKARGAVLDWQHDFKSAIASLNKKHGPISKDSILSSDLMKELSLFGIWGLLKELESKKLDDLDLSSLSHYYDIARDAVKMNINVNWLIKRLDEIEVAIVSREKAKCLEYAKSEQLRKKEEMKEKLERFQRQVKEMQDQRDATIKDLNLEINYHKSNYQRLQTTSGLI